MDFNINDRVMVKRFESSVHCDLNGFYGHVTGHEGELVFVDLQGCTDNAPDKDEREDLIQDDPYPFYPGELDHAD